MLSLVVISVSSLLLIRSVRIQSFSTCIGSSRWQHSARINHWLIDLIGVLTDILEQLLPLVLFLLPLSDIIIRLLLLQALEYGLILHCDFEQLTLSSIAIQRTLG